MKHRGLYHQAEGNEHRPVGASFADRIADNQVAEGADIQVLRRMWKEKKFDAFSAKIKLLQGDGFRQDRIDSMVRQATHGRI